jgi:hypothetical protein
MVLANSLISVRIVGSQSQPCSSNRPITNVKMAPAGDLSEELGKIGAFGSSKESYVEESYVLLISKLPLTSTFSFIVFTCPSTFHLPPFKCDNL